MATLEEVLADITDIRSLRSKRGARKGNLLAYDLIQNRLEEVAGAEALVDEEADVLEQNKFNTELSNNYQNLIDAGKAWVTGERLKDEVQDLNSCDTLSGNYARQTYEQVVKAFRQIIKKLSTYTDLHATKELLEPDIDALHKRIDHELTI